MWRDKFARRLADSQRRRGARDRDLARRRGTEPPSDDADAEQRAMEEDEEVSTKHLSFRSEDGGFGLESLPAYPAG